MIRDSNSILALWSTDQFGFVETNCGERAVAHTKTKIGVSQFAPKIMCAYMHQNSFTSSAIDHIVYPTQVYIQNIHVRRDNSNSNTQEEEEEEQKLVYVKEWLRKVEFMCYVKDDKADDIG